jgi:methylglyoxal synthase
MTIRDKLAVIAHDGRKADLVAWATYNRDRLSEFELVATATVELRARDRKIRVCRQGFPA